MNPSAPPSVFQSLLAGSFSGMAAILVCHPFDVLRTNIQLNPKQPVSNIFKNTFQGGFSALYKGITAPFFAQGLYKSIIFASNTISQRYLFPNSNYYYAIFLGGILAGAVNSLVVSPVEIIRTRQILAGAKDKKEVPLHFMSVIKDIYARNGLKGFWISVIPTIVRDAPGMGFYMLSFDLTKRFLLKSFVPESPSVPLWVRLLAGSAAGIAYWTWAIPVDTLKTIIESSNAKRFSVKQTIEHFTNNFSNLYRGLPIAYLRGIPSAAVTLTVYELAIEELKQKRFL